VLPGGALAATSPGLLALRSCSQALDLSKHDAIAAYGVHNDTHPDAIHQIKSDMGHGMHQVQATTSLVQHTSGLSPEPCTCLGPARYCSYHAKELEAGNQTGRRLQEAQLRRMQEELQLLEQQLEIEGAVRSASVSFLAAKASNLQEASVLWHSRREEDAQNKEREIEVGTGVGLSSSAALNWSMPKIIILLSSSFQVT